VEGNVLTVELASQDWQAVWLHARWRDVQMECMRRTGVSA
jgi:hypothetical protein